LRWVFVSVTWGSWILLDKAESFVLFFLERLVYMNLYVHVKINACFRGLMWYFCVFFWSGFQFMVWTQKWRNQSWRF
jgi:hypothetical protein